MDRLKKLTWAALLIAADIVFARIFYFYTPGNADRISLQFLANALSGALLGPLWGALSCAGGDVLGMLINSSGMNFMPLLTLSAAVRGLLYGLVLYKKDVSFARTLIAVGLVTLIVDLGMNPVFLAMLYERAWLALLLAKIPVRIVTVPVYAGLLFAVSKGLSHAGIPKKLPAKKV